MIKRYCDACGKEIEKNLKKFNPLIHITTETLGYVDNEMNPVSGREVNYDVCLPCYNRIYGEAMKEFRKIQKENGI